MQNHSHKLRRLDIAYISFLIPGVCAFLGTIGGVIVSLLDIEPAYFGFFILIPLMFISAVAIPVGIIITLTDSRRDPALILLCISSIVVVVAGLTESGGDFIALNVVPMLYSLLVVILEVSWFFVRRKTYNEANTAA